MVWFELSGGSGFSDAVILESEYIPVRSVKDRCGAFHNDTTWFRTNELVTGICSQEEAVVLARVAERFGRVFPVLGESDD